MAGRHECPPRRSDQGSTAGWSPVPVRLRFADETGPAYPISVSFTSAVVRSGFIYVAGGIDGNGQITSKAYRLDPGFAS